MTPRECPEFMRCSSNICPLDDGWRARHYAQGEQVCMIMREHVKKGADERFEDYPLLKAIRPACQTVIDEIQVMRQQAGEGQTIGGFGAFLSQVEASAATGSSLDKRKAAGARLRAAVDG
jgi:hypothetical protein